MKILPTTKIPAYTRYGLLVHGAVVTVAGLIMPRNNTEVLVAGVLMLVAAAVLMVLSALAGRKPEVLVGEIVGVQQPQLTDVQAHMRRAPELPQAA